MHRSRSQKVGAVAQYVPCCNNLVHCTPSTTRPAVSVHISSTPIVPAPLNFPIRSAWAESRLRQVMPVADPTRVLSVQSHVVSGYVGECWSLAEQDICLLDHTRCILLKRCPGNRAATFPLQILGYDVDVINTVQFSNHTGYGHTNGYKVTAAQLNAVFEGLWTNGLVDYGRLLTGYVPGAEALEAVRMQVQRMKKERDGLIYLLDRKPPKFNLTV